MNKEYKKISELRNWDKNPRGIKKDKFEELKKRIKRFGQFKPLIVSSDGEVLGGNMRLRAMKDLGIEDAWVSVVNPVSDAEKIEIALADNEEMGYYEEDALAELINEFKDDFDLVKYEIHLGKPTNLKKILNNVGVEEKVDGEVSFTQELLEEHNYLVLYFDNKIDWLNLLSIFKLPSVKALDSKEGFEKQGVGRVVKGSDFINTLKSL